MAQNINLRRTFMVVDELGVDPLRDRSIDAILSVTRWVWFEVDQTTEFNLPLIADKVYSEPDWWWIILIYNGLTDAFQVKRGIRLKVPAAPDITSALSTTLMTVNENRTVEI
jgi:hypothetical protein